MRPRRCLLDEVWGISHQVPRPTQLSSSLWSVVCGAVPVLSRWCQVPGDKQARQHLYICVLCGSSQCMHVCRVRSSWLRISCLMPCSQGSFHCCAWFQVSGCRYVVPSRLDSICAFMAAAIFLGSGSMHCYLRLWPAYTYSMNVS